MADIIRLTPVSAFADNYIWVLHDTTHAIAVDPGDATPLLTFLATQGLQLDAIWITHHHADHIGGLPALAARWPQLDIYGPAGVEHVTQPVMAGSEISAFGQQARVLEVPGHTANHLAFLWQQHLFCGDTLFGAGCGRVFDGTMAQLHASLQQLAALPDDTLCYPAHEYTLSNLQFALAVEPGNAALQARWQQDQASRAVMRPTLPSSIGQEKATNPFLRTASPEVASAATRQAGHALAGSEAIFATLREWKNHFRAA
ncbi:hydroxyacylglutathione hydrolase [Vogesella sp. LIG4]|uniref:hydroxyacylglutathione hydrolase n=1 Tax=Vogesella sp. LIG4 TaxID=1192162 RepID=UPI0008202143|nr:hydroxyacylglutathione hydrolase [Vogesella sp. LIG4]SCK20480.1 hydroxyacylglutathione hydrolase [Vogesella sp. LIG4]